ncbi:MAG: hypothetical protein ACLPN1_08765 [Dissulfurispiraceae bacterium]
MKTESMARQKRVIKRKTTEDMSKQLMLFPGGEVMQQDTTSNKLTGSEREHPVKLQMADSIQPKNEETDERISSQDAAEDIRRIATKWRVKQMQLSLAETPYSRIDRVFPVYPQSKHGYILGNKSRFPREVEALIIEAVRNRRCRSGGPALSVRVIYDILALRIQAENSRRKKSDKLSCPSRSSLYRIISKIEKELRRTHRRIATYDVAGPAPPF